ncbi:hypothetical protein H9Q72_006466 [Fusarium xylarioides]|uniref:Fungal N-terminal domain-containing protein n=1 Tax=Fusarium xylarioides TaxID=221167 RepID=A0A9P7HS18_9HYPO|nr:hypothetical protein H9Q72_006466 [Fusarium xylarioides]
MAEIIGLTSSILTFVEFSAAIISAVQKVREATDGTPQDIKELIKRADDIAEWENKLGLLKSQKKLTLAELKILDTGGACQKTAADIRDISDRVSQGFLKY